jgi:hypothetical protein
VVSTVTPWKNPTFPSLFRSRSLLDTVAVQSPSDPESAVRIRTRLYTRENITIYHAISPFDCRVFSFNWKRIHTGGQAGFRTPATAIIFNSCWLQNLFLDFEVCQNWKVSIYTSEFVRGVRESSLGTHGSVCSVSPLMTFLLHFGLRRKGDFWSCGPAELANSRGLLV